MRWQETAALTAFASATMVAASPEGRDDATADRDAAVRAPRVASSAPASRADAAMPAEAAPHVRDAVGSVTGRVTLLGSARAREVVVYLEPLSTPEPPREAARPEPRPAARPATAQAAAPRDSVGLLWGAMRDLWSAVREQREVLADVRARLVEPDARRRGTVPPIAALPASPFPGAPAADGGTRDATARDAATRASGAATAAPSITPPPPVEMVMERKEFRPHVAVVSAGGSVAWPNGDPFSHNVFSNTPGGSFDLGLYPRGERRAALFRRPGVYEIFCNIHSRMSAFVVAVPSGFWARPSDDGRFVIGNVPPGRYRVHAWHERATEQAQVVTVAGNDAASAALTLDARTFRPVRHANKFGQPYPPATRDEY